MATWAHRSTVTKRYNSLTAFEHAARYGLRSCLTCFGGLDHYHALRTYVLREGRIIHASPVLKVYEFGSSG